MFSGRFDGIILTVFIVGFLVGVDDIDAGGAMAVTFGGIVDFMVAVEVAVDEEVDDDDV